MEAEPRLRWVHSPLLNRVVLLDPGHGGTDRFQATGNGLNEADYAASVADRLGTLFESIGANVVRTRSADSGATTADRVSLARSVEASFVISLHFGHDDRRAGLTAYFSWRHWLTGWRLARYILGDAAETTGLPVAGPHWRRARCREGYEVVHACRGPAVVIELGQMGSISDEATLSDPRTPCRLAGGIFAGVMRFLGWPRELWPVSELESGCGAPQDVPIVEAATLESGTPMAAEPGGEDENEVVSQVGAPSTVAADCEQEMPVAAPEAPSEPLEPACAVADEDAVVMVPEPPPEPAPDLPPAPISDVLSELQSEPLVDAVTEQSPDAATESYADALTEPSSDTVTEPPSDTVTEPPSDTLTETSPEVTLTMKQGNVPATSMPSVNTSLTQSPPLVRIGAQSGGLASALMSGLIQPVKMPQAYSQAQLIAQMSGAQLPQGAAEAVLRGITQVPSGTHLKDSHDVQGGINMLGRGIRQVSPPTTMRPIAFRPAAPPPSRQMPLTITQPAVKQPPRRKG